MVMGGMISATTAARASCRVMTASVALEMPARTYVQLACDSVLALRLSAFEARRTFVFNASPERSCHFEQDDLAMSFHVKGDRMSLLAIIDVLWNRKRHSILVARTLPILRGSSLLNRGEERV